MKKERQFGLDLIRALAISMVFLIHMLAICKVLSNELQSPKWVIYDFSHFLSMIAVPLFLLLTGYLQARKKLNSRHYISGLPTILSYFLTSGVAAALMVYAFGMPKGGLARLILHIFDFTYGYAWYMEMYICLFMLIPFLNILFEALNHKQQIWMIGILALLTLLPSVVSNFIVTGIWCEVMPDFLENMYVITYYFIGAYICKYRPAPSRIWCAVVALVVLVGETLISFVLSSKEYAWYVSNSFSSLAHAVVAVSIFLLLYQVQFNFKPLRWLVGEIATCSFEMYLLSYFTDSYLYKIIPLSPWQILMINFVVTYIGARLLRCAVAPLGNLLKKGVLHLSENRKSVL